MHAQFGPRSTPVSMHGPGFEVPNNIILMLFIKLQPHMDVQEETESVTTLLSGTLFFIIRYYSIYNWKF